MKKLRKATGIVFCAGFGLVLFVMIINTIMIGFSERYILSEDEASKINADCVLAPGAKVFSSGSLSAALEDRVKTAIKIYRDKGAKKLLLSGDHGRKTYDEVNAMKKYALNAGVPLDDIFLDHAGFSTYESMYRARDVFGVKKVIIVTQTYHLYRSIYIARKLGLEAYGVSSSLRYSISEMNYIREIPARFKDFFTAIFQPLPTYLGDPIDISASGVQTHD